MLLLIHLPPELIGRIISLAGGPYDPNDYRKRLRTLRRCCLVSRSFREIAQPELFAVLEVKRTERLEAFRAAAKATCLGRTTGTAVFRRRGSKEGVLTAQGVRAALEELPSLREVRIYGVDGIDIGWLAALPELRHLVLCDLTLTSSSISFALPRLVQLSAYYVFVKAPLSPTCFTAETAPCLRRVAIVAHGLGRVFRGQLLRQPSPDLASKLEIMVVDYLDWQGTLSASPSCGPRTVIDCPFTYCFDPTLPPISHLRLLPDGKRNRNHGRTRGDSYLLNEKVNAFITLADMLSVSHPVVSTLRTVHLPVELEFDQVQKFHTELFLAYLQLSSVCAEKGVEILLDVYPEYDIDPYIPNRLDWIGTEGSGD
ncbi:hypothetical protein JCM1840_003838 [Sporobolomyces johnsonii]